MAVEFRSVKLLTSPGFEIIMAMQYQKHWELGQEPPKKWTEHFSQSHFLKLQLRKTHGEPFLGQ